MSIKKSFFAYGVILLSSLHMSVIANPTRTLSAPSTKRPDTYVKVHHLTPPRLGDSDILKKVLCIRPMRKGSPKMSVTIKGDQVIAHNYGHGGSGWTLAPGCAQYVNDLLINSSYSKD